MRWSALEKEIINVICNLREIYEMFADDISKDIFLKRIAYSVSGDNRYISDIVRKYRPEFTPLLSWGGIVDLYALIPDKQNYIIWGTGNYGLRFLECVVGDERLVAFCDRNIEKQRNGFCGYKVISPDDLFTEKYANVAVIVASGNYEKEILQELKTHDKAEQDIYLMGSVINRASDKQYFGEEFIRFGENEIFVDAGSYDLDSTMTFYRLCPSIKKAYAFEPDFENYAKCKRIKEENGLKEVKLFSYGTWDNKTTLRFQSRADSSRIREDGEVTVETISIDEALQGEDVTYIKLDVEGAEYRSLVGAQKTIQRCRPRIAACVYHKPEDIIVLPMYIKSLVSDYRFYLRHYSNANNETVLYAIP